MTQPTIMIDVPLTPNVLAQAGVSIADALWIHRLPTPAVRSQVIQRTPRGKDILFRVRQFLHEATMSGNASMPSA